MIAAMVMPAATGQRKLHIVVYSLSRDSTRAHGYSENERLEVVVNTRLEPAIYSRHPSFPKVRMDVNGECIASEQLGFCSLGAAKLYVNQCINIINFADRTLLRPGRVWRPYLCAMSGAPGWDHASVWRNFDDELVLLNEPSEQSGGAQSFMRWCDRYGWQYMPLPSGVGTHPLPGHSCILAAPPYSRAQLGLTTRSMIERFSEAIKNDQA